MKGCTWILFAISAYQVVAGSPQWRPECPSMLDSAFITHPFDCGRLYYCLGGVAHPVACPPGAQWNQSLGRCDNNSVAPCQRSQPIVSRTSSEPNSLCPFDDDVAMGRVYFIPNENEYQRIIRCSNGHAYMLSCSPGEYWNVEHYRCDNFMEQQDPQAISMRSAISPSCTPMTDLGGLQAVPFLKNVGVFFRCQLDKSYVLMIYIQLADASLSAVTSSPSTSSVVTSPASTRPTTGQATSATINPNLPVPMPQCSDPNSVVRFGIPGECRAYLQCHQGRAYKIYCRTGREWSEAANKCIETSSAGCSSVSPIIETAPPTIATTAMPALAAARLIYIPSTYSSSSTSPSRTTARPTNAPTTCSAEAQFISHPTDCRKFIQCDNGRALVRECPHPLFWNAQIATCDWNCES